MKTTVLLVATIAFGSVASAAPIDKLNITPEEHAACDGDAINLCSFAYPDEDQLLACMKSNRHRLSSACETAFVSGFKKRHIPL